MNKTPVSILQEMMVKKGTVPNYELIYDGGGSHINTFTFQVTCDGLSATGTGRCKKDAKHEAAKTMLETIAKHRSYPQLPASPAQSPMRTPLPAQIPPSPKIPPNAPFINAIGALQDLCAENELRGPEYVAISDVGPPHARVFTIRCIVSTFKEEGTATTKKQAKHDAAKKMLDRIMDVVSDIRSSDATDFKLQNEESRKQEMMASEIAKARYPGLCPNPATTKKVNLGMKLCQYHTKLKSSYDEKAREEFLSTISTLGLVAVNLKADNMNNISIEESIIQLRKDFHELMKSMKIDFQKHLIEVEDKSRIMTAIRLNTSPEIIEFGFGCTHYESELSMMFNMLKTLEILLE
ncbi:RISC-loading complex subunit TARBP2-like [Cephus cinctus]|uniref:RISC-loading complex subunit TARBP2-like n=1 Tax=Cephus cinctus TaxID=211228 RepID=A0AAJ7CE00_CEPCN|nr:RISC-loading complex subunit TARBP2-like [Cephus cinctus]